MTPSDVLARATRRIVELEAKLAAASAELEALRRAAPICVQHAGADQHAGRTCCDVDRELDFARAQLDAIEEAAQPARERDRPDRPLTLPVDGDDLPLDVVTERLESNALEWPVVLLGIEQIIAERDRLRAVVDGYSATARVDNAG